MHFYINGAPKCAYVVQETSLCEIQGETILSVRKGQHVHQEKYSSVGETFVTIPFILLYECD